MLKFLHPFHLVEKSPWPLTVSINCLILTNGLLKWFHELKMNLLFTGILMITLNSFKWWRDVNRESCFQGLHTKKVKKNMTWGMILFITSEILFFFSFFWAFFHSSLNSTIEIGLMWPPMDITPFNPYKIPLLNTMILLSSGITVTWSHHAITQMMYEQTTMSLITTILLGIYFTILQSIEYMESFFCISDSIYGTTFFLTTGFHGFHVIMGTILLIVSLMRINKKYLTSNHHMGFEASIWYWHFVDIVWLFLYTFMYWWGY